jgi:branched-chain amino acid aminotransferase
VRDNKLESCYLRPIVFYGSHALGVAAKSNPVRVAIAVWPWGAYLGAEALESGIRVKTSSFTHHHPNITMCNAKAVCNYSVSILANQEATHDGYEEAMLMDPQGYVCQGSGENVFMVRDGKLHTPTFPAARSTASRATRSSRSRTSSAFRCRSAGSRATSSTSPTKRSFTGTAAEVTPIREYDHRPIGEGRAVPITTRLQATLLRHGQRPQSIEEGVAHEDLTWPRPASRRPSR